MSKFESYAPILIFSPEKRCGSTLVQRLMCSSSNTLIYGEHCAQDLSIIIQLFHQKKQLFEQYALENDAQLNRVIRGELNEWISHLFPPMKEYFNSMESSFSSLLKGFSTAAGKSGRTQWGLKLAGWPSFQLELIRAYLPQAKLIAIQRNLADCVSSAKACGMLRCEDDVIDFARNWKMNSAFIKKNKNWLHIIDYANLISNSEVEINKLEKFTGAKDIDMAVLSVKVNSESHSLSTENAENYIEPLPLATNEKEIVISFE